MALTREQSLIWQAMGIGPQWILRDTDDPLAPAVKPAPQAASPARAQAPTSAAATVRPSAKVAAPVRRAPVKKPEPAPVPVAGDHTPEVLAALPTASWEQVAQFVKNCHVCEMSAWRTNTVFADGAPGCPMVIVGEAPGRDEDIQGVPFVGKSGELLTKILAACGLKRGSDVAIVNVLKCRPPRNRDPKEPEMRACAAFLERQLALLQPKVLVLMGRYAAQQVLGRSESLGALRGRTWTHTIAGREVPCVVTYHPSYLLRSPVNKEKSWHDLLAACDILHGREPIRM